MPWVVHSERPLYQDQWLDIRLADVELPDGRHLDHRVIHVAPSAGAVVTNDAGDALLLWRHRFIRDTWAYEIPIGRIELDERPMDAAAREFREETGWTAGALRPLVRVQPATGIMTAEHHIFHGTGAEQVGPPEDATESERIEWVPLERVPELVAARQIVCGTTMSALLYAFATIRREPRPTRG